MKSNVPARVCVIGVGNPIRSDDGLGPYICSLLDAVAFPGVDTLQLHQLHTDVIEDLFPYDHVVVVDASVEGENVAFYVPEGDQTTAVASSHHMNVAMLHALAQTVYGKTLSFRVCAVRGESFEMGDQLTAAAKANAAAAVKVISEWISLL
jgi:hydrogenase maturation protease